MSRELHRGEPRTYITDPVAAEHVAYSAKEIRDGAKELRLRRKAIEGFRPKALQERTKYRFSEFALTHSATIVENAALQQYQSFDDLSKSAQAKFFVYEAGLRAQQHDMQYVNTELARIMQLSPGECMDLYNSRQWQHVPVLSRAITEVALALASPKRRTREFHLTDNRPKEFPSEQDGFFLDRLWQMLAVSDDGSEQAPQSKEQVVKDFFTLLGMSRAANRVPKIPDYSPRGSFLRMTRRVPDLPLFVLVEMESAQGGLGPGQNLPPRPEKITVHVRKTRQPRSRSDNR